MYLFGVCSTFASYSKTLNNRTGGRLITSTGGGPGDPGTNSGFCSPGGGFSGSRRSGKPLRFLRLKKTPPGLQKPVPGSPRPSRYSLLATPGTIIERLRVIHRPLWGQPVAEAKQPSSRSPQYSTSFKCCTEKSSGVPDS